MQFDFQGQIGSLTAAGSFLAAPFESQARRGGEVQTKLPRKPGDPLDKIRRYKKKTQQHKSQTFATEKDRGGFILHV